MANTIIKSGQSLMDVAIQATGSVGNVCALAQLNGLGITDYVPPGTSLILPNVTDAVVVERFKANNQQPASGNAENPTGIDYWIIGLDFIVT